VDLTARLVLIALYPLLLVARVVSMVSGHDPLRLKEPEGSCWIERPPMPHARTYFAESDSSELSSSAGAAIKSVARAFAPPEGEAGPSRTTHAALPSDIPDEVYTLW
jgi:hypothetical protein